MKHTFLPMLLLPFGLLLSCNASVTVTQPINGTWRLISGATITKGDTVTIDYTKGTRMIKIINDHHFAFLKHDIDAPKDSANHFDAGGGSYTLEGVTYTEHLDYYSDRNWEGKTFTFTVDISNDTLTQKGIEKVEGAGVDHEIIERYVREK
ncbi:lipocalin-like domain-containing protein [Chitinophaga agrisoli]|uniref:Lipocalin-like domain-containing protein n=1 Tax=Chitinophaga agrisoli TaxID=2607653 RepID=A0A5B2VVN7_9BACT|nr:lipocalin-like domain-containing protein [Chitinophaga agrisoli]KAA2243341.1 lipocalin-like domain-containing protein [Chitinophaga agrisoli]